MDPRDWKGFYEDFSRVNTIGLELIAADSVNLTSGQWKPVEESAADQAVTHTSQTESGATLTFAAGTTDGESGIVQMDGAAYILQANQPAVFETRCAPVGTLATATWFVGMGKTVGTIDQFITAGGAAFTGTDGFFFYGHDTAGATSRAAAYTSSSESLMGTGTVTTTTMVVFTMIFDGVTLSAYQDGVLMGSTTTFPTASLAPCLGYEDGASSSGAGLEMDYMLFYQKTSRGDVQY